MVASAEMDTTSHDLRERIETSIEDGHFFATCPKILRNCRPLCGRLSGTIARGADPFTHTTAQSSPLLI
jgi:hypothetical protein